MIRILDIVFSGLALLVFLPFLIPVAVVLRLTGEGEVFYVQSRLGLDGVPFGLIKFATMLKDSPKQGAGEVTVRNDPRVLPVGRFLRKTKINELPQLLNILRGDMSVIGPRPQTQRCFDAFPMKAQQAITSVRPGLSGVGSIIFRDEEAVMQAHQDPNHFYDRVVMPYKGEVEVWFVKNRSFWLYLYLIIMTCVVILFPRWDLRRGILRQLPEMPSELKSAFEQAL